MMRQGIGRMAGAAICGLGLAWGAAAAEDEVVVTDGAGNEEVIHEIGRFHPAYGAQLTYDYCTACHSEMIIAQQGQDRDGWDEILVWMVEDMGMGELVPEDREVILDYLAAHYGPDRPHYVLE
jgi:cytochrome c